MRKQTFSQESSDAGNSPLTPKHRDVITRDMAEKPFPTKPVCHRKVDKSTSHVIDVKSKSQDARSLDKDQSKKSKSLTGEQHLTKLIHEKQLLLQRKLLKVEDMLREKVQPHNVGVSVYKGNQLVEKKQSGKQQKIVKSDTKTMQTADVKCSETVTNGQTRKQEQKTRQDKTEHGPKWDPKNAGGTLTKRKDESKSKPGHSEQITDFRKVATENLQKASGGLATESLQKASGGLATENLQKASGGLATESLQKASGGLATESLQKASGGLATENLQKASGGLATENLQKARGGLATNDKAAGRTPHKEPLPQVFESLSELEHADQNPPGLPCSICKRRFNKPDRLEKHMQICEKLRNKKRPVFNVTLQRMKGSYMEDYLKNHARSSTPEILRKKKQERRQKKAL